MEGETKSAFEALSVDEILEAPWRAIGACQVG
jgi:hypothetical protein